MGKDANGAHPTPPTAGRPRRGPRGETADLRGAIVDAAVAEFSEKGVHAATLRGISARAGVAPKLIHYYFGSKAGLAKEVMSQVFVSSGLADTIFEAVMGGAELGEAYLRTVLNFLDDTEAGRAYIGLIRSVGTDEESRQILLDFLGGELFAMTEGSGARTEAELRLRLTLAGSQILGIVMARYIVAFGPLADADPETIVRLAGPTLNRYLTGPLEV
ncbi:TetR family transcriptional regulator [Schaalia sp. 19OD2882]|uniref:TetR/AcrR family transcriptional regulator n=1 Tax=Schaalia sp. 19OD2882 TaxID=2794089 RepID=UPI001C1EDC06|nr:TetR family transcriptional regulator [Schaalia sp. 19OD2882]QWW19755.1 TetR family transcriptional regulator [Schaalia sp. 19OD2882]